MARAHGGEQIEYKKIAADIGEVEWAVNAALRRLVLNGKAECKVSGKYNASKEGVNNIINVIKEPSPRKEAQSKPQPEAPSIEPAQEPQPQSSSKEIIPITIADLQMIEPGETPRVRDIRLGERLEYGQGRERRIQEMIENPKVMAELLRYGTLPTRTATLRTGNGAMKEVQEYWLNEAQCTLLVMKSNADGAVDVRQEIIAVYTAWHQGKTAPKGFSEKREKPQRWPSRYGPIPRIPEMIDRGSGGVVGAVPVSIRSITGSLFDPVMTASKMAPGALTGCSIPIDDFCYPASSLHGDGS